MVAVNPPEEPHSGAETPISSGGRRAREEWTPPEEFDEYRLVRPLGRGSMGLVYLAQDRVLDRPVAVKFISSAHASKNERERFMVEARAVARLHHPNIMAIHRVGELAGNPYLVCEFINGRSLNDLEVPLSWQQVQKIAIGLARGLGNAHRHGVLHRDIKLANVMLSAAEEVKILDFSLAKLMKDPTQRRRRPADDEARQASLEEPPGAPGGVKAKGAALPAAVQSRIGELGDAAREQTLARLDAGNLSAIADTARRAADEGESKRPGQITQDGALVGTPHYMAPELWHGEPASRASDIYAVGVVLYALLTGRTPYGGMSITELASAILEGDHPPILSLAPTCDPRFSALVDRCLKHFPGERFASGEELRSALELMTPSGRKQQIPSGNPYRGLRAFEAEHRALFFGRSAEIRAVTERLRGDPFVLVAGDSGVGKSSLCRAGVVPMLEDGALEPERQWSSVAMMPGRRPLQVLVSALATRLEVDEESMHALLVESPMSFGWFVRKQLGVGRGLVIFVDQLEELVTIADKEQAKVVGGVLAQIAAGIAGVRLLASARGDFLTRVAEIPELGEEISRSIYLLRPLTREGAREAIAGPAQLQGARFEDEALVDSLIDAGVEGSLPLLQFALAELWEVRDAAKGLISRANLEQIGGVTGALARHGDGALASLLPAQRSEARRILLRLVTIEDTRANLSGEELVGDSEAAKSALEALVRSRLLVVRETADGVIYEIAHEALVHGWGTLRGWLDEEREARIIAHSLETAASEWERLRRPRDALWGAAALARAGALDPAGLRPRERDFLQASRRALVRSKRLRRAIFAAIPLALVGLYGAVKVEEYRALAAKVEARLTAAKAALEEARGQAQALQVQREEAFRRFDSRDPEGGEALWAEVVGLSPRLDRRYKEALQGLEAALILDPGNDEARALLAETLHLRALLAEEEHDTKQVEELRERLALYDEGEVYKSRWQAPGSLQINARPAGTTVTIAEYTKEESGRYTLGDARPLGATPIAGVSLAPGSYLLVFEREEVSIRYPLLVRRSEELEINFEMPAAAAIPEGFVYVPPGRFLFGSADDDGLRKSFYYATPLHQVTTEAYLIAKHEVTFAEWIEFLEAQPADAREELLPRSDLLSLVYDGGRPELKIQVGDEHYVLPKGERMAYKGRSARQEQDWWMWPVTGLDFTLAAAYARWSAESGRVAGAHVCSDWEWERAARGSDARRYPHGDILTPEFANFDQTYGSHAAKGPDVIGSFASGVSPFGVDDMAGNAAEWVTSSLDDNVMFRGGGFSFDPIMATAYNRAIVPEGFRDWQTGLRICAPAP
jgi:serine/threonine protein kinase/formylglycine-generating enzyme required for sulfatase activity